MRELAFSSASSLVEALRKRDLSAIEITEAILARIAQINPVINAYSAVARERALADAEKADDLLRSGAPTGRLHGVPVSVKDIIHTKGIRTTCGSRLYANLVPDEDAIVVERLKQAGAVIIGKTNTAEFGHLPITDNALFGETRNPWDHSRTAGGSSGGSAAAVAAGLGPVSIGNDGGGSIRIPAALCGVVGFKPTFGAIPQYPRFSGWDLLGHTGPFARNVADIKLVMDVVAGPDVRDPDSIMCGACLPRSARELADLRIGWTLSLDDVAAEPDVANLVTVAAKEAIRIGCRVEEVSLDWGDRDHQFRVLVASEIASVIDARSAEMTVISPTLARLVDFGHSLSACDYARAMRWRTEATRRIFDWFSRFDLLLLPTSPIEAFTVGQIGPKEIAGRKVSPFAWVSWTSPFNITRQPALSLPCGLTAAGLPVGLQIVAPYGADDLLLRFAAAMEERLAFTEQFGPKSSLPVK